MVTRQIFESFDAAREEIVSGEERLRQLFIHLSKADGGTLFDFDLLVCAAIQRSLSLSAAVMSLASENNYLAAASLLRLQLDSCLRLHAAWLVEKPHDYSRKVLRGIPARKQRATTGEFLTDQFLVDSLNKEFPWIENVYKECSGFVHLSEKHTYATFEGASDDGKISLALGPTQPHIGTAAALELLTAFHHATYILTWLLTGWLKTKSRTQR